MIATGAGPALAQEIAGESGRDSKGFFIKGGEARLNLGGFTQFRYYANFRDDSEENEDLTQGFVLRKTRVVAQGDLNAQWSYKAELDLSSDGLFRPTDAFGAYKDGDIRVRFGQFKLPLLKEELVSDTEQLTVDRSTLNAVFTGSRSQGVELNWSGEQTRLFAMVSDGLSALNTDFAHEKEADFGLTLRGEWLWEGADFKPFDSFTGRPGKAYTGMLGGALHYQDGGETTNTTDQSTFIYTIDASAKGDGWSAFLAGVGRTIEPASGSSLQDFGWLAQAGTFVTDYHELFARFIHVIPDDDRASGDDFREITIGAAYYPFAESAMVKFSADVTYTFDDQASAGDVIKARVSDGLLVSGSEQTYFRIQAQFVF
jgi:hypothetical protein